MRRNSVRLLEDLDFELNPPDDQLSGVSAPDVLVMFYLT